MLQLPEFECYTVIFSSYFPINFSFHSNQNNLSSIHFLPLRRRPLNPKLDPTSSHTINLVQPQLSICPVKKTVQKDGWFGNFLSTKVIHSFIGDCPPRKYDVSLVLGFNSIWYLDTVKLENNSYSAHYVAHNMQNNFAQ